MNKLALNSSNNLTTVLNNNSIRVINFLNSHDLYQFYKNERFRNTFDSLNYNFIDGFILKLFLSLKKVKKVKRFSGPDFIKYFFEKEQMKRKKHLFIGADEKDVKILMNKFNYLKKKNLFYYNPPYIKEEEFPEKEIQKMSDIINTKKIDIIWIGLGCPKQNFLSFRLLGKTKAKKYINIGAGLDFLLGKKKRAPKLFRMLGIEWFYRLITDFKHTRKKAGRSFLALRYLKYTDLK